ncbi:hypothetical protein SB6424_05501 [Klebsiella pasteurii]|nr:hypothetical protein SB04697_04911 [Klebsiella quasipneumoniae subsp. similipneumoniae]VUS85025.1 hypothetical protein SB6416_05380 [Klebsiella pasteurii]VUS88559.1 hypothetical protein SB6424_05501 [Klebsiella pasteurii]
MGSTLSCGASVDDLASVARKWYRQYMEERRKYLTLMSQLEDLL